MKIRFTYNDGRTEETLDVQHVEWASGKYDGAKIELPVVGGALELEYRKQPDGALTADGEKVHSLLVAKSNPNKIVAYEAGDAATWVQGAPEMNAPAAETKATASEAAPAETAKSAKDTATPIVATDFEDDVEGPNRQGRKFRKPVSEINPEKDLDEEKLYRLVRGSGDNEQTFRVTWAPAAEDAKDVEGNTVLGVIQNRERTGRGADKKYTVHHHAVMGADGKPEWKSGAPEYAKAAEAEAEKSAEQTAKKTTYGDVVANVQKSASESLGITPKGALTTGIASLGAWAVLNSAGALATGTSAAGMVGGMALASLAANPITMGLAIVGCSMAYSHFKDKEVKGTGFKMPEFDAKQLATTTILAVATVAAFSSGLGGLGALMAYGNAVYNSGSWANKVTESKAAAAANPAPAGRS